MWRGLSLGATMAPLLFWVPAGAWARVPAHAGFLAAATVLAAAANVCGNSAARFLPFNVRAAVIGAGSIVFSLGIGWLFLAETPSAGALFAAGILAVSAVALCLGEHRTPAFKPDIPRGVALAIACAAALCAAVLFQTRFLRATHPLLAAWMWEFAIGLVCVPFVMGRRSARAPGWGPRAWRVGVASTPTVVGTGATALALGIGPMGIAYALSGFQTILTAFIGARFHHERIGPWRWALIGIGSAAAVGVAFL